MRVTDLWLYPVKSMGGHRIVSRTVEPWGLAGDRRWALVDAGGDLVTARELHALLRFTAEWVDDETLRITDRGDGEAILVDTPFGVPPVAVVIARQPTAHPADADVNRWITERLGQRLQLVWQEDPSSRPIRSERGGRPGESVSLADAAPLLLTSSSSMAQLNAWIDGDAGRPDVTDIDPADLSGSGASSPPTLDIRRFRPNVIVDGETPFEEDGWSRVQIGDVWYRQTMVCDRCVMTTLDPDTVAGGKEPIRTLARHRRWNGKTWFGIRLTPISGGDLITIGDEVRPVVDEVARPSPIR